MDLTARKIAENFLGNLNYEDYLKWKDTWIDELENDITNFKDQELKKIKKFSQGEPVAIQNEDGSLEIGEFHRYGETRNGAIAFFNGIMRFVDEQSLMEVKKDL
jgi:hypothetical protein